MNFHPQSRLWIYQADRFLTDTEIGFLNEKLTIFTKNWTAHQQQLASGFLIKNRLFIILIVDESKAGASGCSIDKSVHLMKEIEVELGVHLFDRFRTAWRKGNEIHLADRAEMEVLVKNGIINSETKVFNNLIDTYQDLQSNWEIPFVESWHSKVFKAG